MFDTRTSIAFVDGGIMALVGVLYAVSAITTHVYSIDFIWDWVTNGYGSASLANSFMSFSTNHIITAS